ncbi:MAG: ABC transporter substrate-binding protein [Candidatus ainarchaeum sp.]|nr:ABC transporter substrate-binding protein [Candidatus ainarchaeum sp.]
MVNKVFSWAVVAVLIIVIVVLVVVFTGGNSEKEVIKIGVVGPLTGDIAQYGLSYNAAVELAAEKANYEIDGKKVEFIVEDGKCNGTDATTAFNKLIHIDQVDFIIGGFCSSETLAGMPIAEASKILTLSPTSSNPGLKNAGEFLVTLYPLDDFEGTFDAEYVYTKLGAKTVALIVEQSDWPKGISDAFIKKYEELGGKIVAKESNEQNAKDLKMQLTKIASLNPDLIYVAQYTGSLANLLTQRQELGITIPLMAPQFIEDGLIKTVGSAAEGVYGSIIDVPIMTQEMEIEIKELSGLSIPEKVFSLFAYDAFNILKKTIEDKKTLDSTVLKDYMLTQTYTGLTGSYIFDKDGGNISAAFKVEKVVDGIRVTQPQ